MECDKIPAEIIFPAGLRAFLQLMETKPNSSEHMMFIGPLKAPMPMPV